MKRLHKFILLLTLLLSVQAAHATEITLNSFSTGPLYQQADTVAVLRLYYSDTFVDSEGVVVLGGAVGSSNFYKQVTCSVNTSTKVATCPLFTMPSTTDSSKPTVTLTGVLYGGRTATSVVQRGILFTNWKVPASQPSWTFTALNTYNSAKRPANPDTYYTADQTESRLASLTLGFGDAFTTNPISQFAPSTSLQIKSLITDESGSGALVFGTAPTLSGATLTSPIITNIAPGANLTITQNSVAPFTSINASAVANTLVLNAGNVGIGTAAPGALLTVERASSFFGSGNPQFRLSYAGNTTLNAYIDGSGTTILENLYGDTNFIFNPLGGNVGIGVDPTQKLSVAGTVHSTTGGFRFPDGTTQTTAASGDALVANPLSQFAATSSQQLKTLLNDETGSGASVFGTSPTISSPVITNIAPGADFSITQNSVAAFKSVNASAVVDTLVLTGGKVTIGTGITTPTALLTVNRQSGSFGSSNPQFRLSYFDTPTLNVFIDGSGTTIVENQYADKAFIFNPDGGNIGIGVDPSYALDVVGDVNVTGNFKINGVNIGGGGGGGDALVSQPLSQFSPTTSLQLKNTISNETGSDSLVFQTSPTLSNPIIANIAPGANFTLTQNSVAPFTSVNASAVANTLVLKAGNVGIGTATPTVPLTVIGKLSVDPQGFAPTATATAPIHLAGNPNNTSQYLHVSARLNETLPNTASPEGFILGYFSADNTNGRGGNTGFWGLDVVTQVLSAGLGGTATYSRSIEAEAGTDWDTVDTPFGPLTGSLARVNGIEVVSIGGHSFKPTCALCVWTNGTDGSNWWKAGLYLSRVANIGIWFEKLSDDAVSPFGTALIFADSPSPYVIKGGARPFTNGIDFTASTITTCAFCSPNFVVTGGGLLGLGMPPVNLVDAVKTQDAPTFIQVANGNAGTSSQVGFTAVSDLGQISIRSHATERVATRYGIAVGGWNELLGVTGNGLLIGTNTAATPIVFGNNSTERLRIDASGGISINGTITAGATTGAQTINKPSGSVNFAAAATSLVVTNSLVTTSSVIQCTVATNDATMKSAQCVAGSGSFTIFPNANPTAETRVNFTLTGVN